MAKKKAGPGQRTLSPEEKLAALLAAPVAEGKKDRPLVYAGNHRLVFALDATASRQPTWRVAQSLTVQMFDALPEGLEIALAYHSGGRMRPWSQFTRAADRLRKEITQVKCEAGETALNPILGQCMEIPSLRAMIYIGDCFEEDEDDAINLAHKLHLKGVRCFFFQDRLSPHSEMDYVSQVFGEIAKITEGALFDFDQRSPKRTGEEMQAIARLAAGGIAALQQDSRNLPGAIRVLEKLK
ncbi:MAG: hypothetical protein HPY59_07505 [Anaerolineae bacterium]|nr:hypothetical protein [Anaerolineae bacterium]